MSVGLPPEDAMVREEENLFSRDIDGHLMRMDPVIASDLDKDITVTIDGRAINVKKAVPVTDSQGNILHDAGGRPIPRPTTIYDAASRLFGADNPIPTICHQEHLNPVGVCRVCVVELWQVKRGSKRKERKLLPACQHRVENDMEVHTIASPSAESRKRVTDTVKILTELLRGDHLPAGQVQPAPYDELAALCNRLGVDDSRFARTADQQGVTAPFRGRDDSSLVIAVNHDACILCDRCVRACDDVKKNLVIGRTGKGYTTRIGFDLDQKMGESSCVSCGECMISCPTQALTAIHLKHVVDDKKKRVRPGAGVEQELAVEDLKRLPLFAGISYKFLLWCLQGEPPSIRRLKLKRGEMLFREGEPGSTAFVLLSGKFQLSIQSVLKQEHYQQAKWLPALFGRIQNKVFSNRSKASGRGVIRTADGAILDLIDPAAERTPEDVILGEMTCLSHYPRSATVTLEEDGEVLEIGSNVLHYLQRNRSSREIFDRAYRDRALAHYLRSSQLFNYPDPAARRDGNGSSPATPPDIMSEARDLSEALSGQRSLEPGVAQAVEQFRELTKRRRRLSLEVLGVVERLCQTIDAAKSSVHTSHLQLADRLAQAIPDERERLECVEFLRARAELVRVDKGQLIFRQGDRADHFYLVRLGFVRISQTNGQQDIVRNYLGPGSSFGEIGLLAPLLESEGQADRPPSRRTATCTALDDVELVRIRGDHFQEMIDNFRGVRDKLVHYARTLLQRDDASRKALSGPIDQFLEQGLFEAQKLLVLDLESCTRCDECTRACADSHGGVTRLIREGLRFDKYLVASSCRSCLDPYCLVGCPVDAIHRRPRDGSDTSLEIVIEDWCIGCGQCAKNCPYGNINMYGFPEEATRDGHQVSWTQMKATTCDLCRKAVPNPNDDPSCVYACPHNAAFRMSGADLLARIKQAEDKP